MSGSPAPRYIAMISDFEDCHLKPTVRAFRYVDTARFWVSQIHAYLYNGPTKGFVASAELFKIGHHGESVLIDEYSGYDRGDGIAEGWENTCKWNHAENDHGCDHSPVKGDTLCRYHRKDSKYTAPESGIMGGGYVERIPDEEFAKYKDYVGPQSVFPRLGGLLGSRETFIRS